MHERFLQAIADAVDTERGCRVYLTSGHVIRLDVDAQADRAGIWGTNADDGTWFHADTAAVAAVSWDASP